MPRVARWLIKTALVYLAAALALSVGRAGAEAALWVLPEHGIWISQLHAFTVGWLTQLIFGVAYWLFPRPHRHAPDSWTPVVWSAYGLLNVGLLLRLVFEPGWMHLPIRNELLLAAALLQGLSGGLFVAYFWRRVRVK